jgi:hypothetical protein
VYDLDAYCTALTREVDLYQERMIWMPFIYFIQFNSIQEEGERENYNIRNTNGGEPNNETRAPKQP